MSGEEEDHGVPEELEDVPDLVHRLGWGRNTILL